MTYKQQYRSSRRYAIFTLAIALSDFFLAGYFHKDSWMLIPFSILGFASCILAYVHYDDMRKAKRYIVFDNFLEEEKHDPEPGGFMSKEKVETKSIAMWWKVNEELHQN